MNIEVFTADLHAMNVLDEAASILSADERERADRFRFAQHRQRFTRCRILLRQLLGQHLARDPASLVFRYGEWGKPELDGVHFNVSHSDRIAVIAWSREHAVGIDVERIDRTKDVVPLAHTAFSPAECEAFDAMPADQQVEAFFRTWARKEALMKLRGRGFSLPSHSFTVSVAKEPLTFLDDCAIRDLDVNAGFACAIAAAPEALL
ncbi:MAG TPA: 4'-phosphopantetheinyl transferase superfamily protein [Thermoanaerobaculia bacterium]|nr:4'-phosphopantetheinyl transferase superfamily protein [Thermoanaerobaculia bacterium]